MKKTKQLLALVLALALAACALCVPAAAATSHYFDYSYVGISDTALGLGPSHSRPFYSVNSFNNWTRQFRAAVERYNAKHTDDPVVMSELPAYSEELGDVTITFTATSALPKAAAPKAATLREALTPYLSPLDVDVTVACNDYNAAHGTSLTPSEYWDLEGWKIFGDSEAAAPAASEQAASVQPTVTAEEQAQLNAAFAAALADYQAEIAAREAAFAAAVAR